jgi:hypothetical protein
MTYVAPSHHTGVTPDTSTVTYPATAQDGENPL